MASGVASGEASSPLFPSDLEREIFETAAELYPETIYNPSLLLVAKRVYEWIERIKFRAVTSDAFSPACPLRLLQKAIRLNNKPAKFFHDRVRHLFISASREDELQTILSACTGLRSLVLGGWAGPSILPSLAGVQLRRLSISLDKLYDGIDDIDLSHPAFTFVTHLESFDAVPFFNDDFS
ncbi:hypothetical protein FB451DRAFT_1223457 [Mycena latifolia]|nr:hypothetical protein FB451DRAFT_1223457 [Mycena latifolia]